MTASVLDVLSEVKTWDASEASEKTIYAGEGMSLSAHARRRRKASDPTYQRYLLEAGDLYRRVLHGDRWAALQFAEAMSTSDFSNLFGDILDRQILAKYVSQPVQWTQLAKRGTVRDFRTVKRFTVDGGEAILDEVKQLTEYPAAKLVDGAYSYAVKKYGRRFPLSWETLINDDLDAFRDIPDRMGNAARRSEERFAASLYAGSSGPNSTFFATANKNVINPTVLPGGSVTNPPLTITNLQYAFQVLASQLDTDGAPIYIEGVTLVVPPALMVPAENILNATQIWTAQGSGGAASDAGRPDQLVTVNWMANKVRLVVNPWLPIISTTNGNTSWYLFADPAVGRPAMEIGFLTGHEQPEMFQKSPNATRVGGGAVPAEDGDFDSDSIEWKIRHVFGGTLMDPKSAVASNGTGS
jgi:hypothetical protein